MTFRGFRWIGVAGALLAAGAAFPVLAQQLEGPPPASSAPAPGPIVRADESGSATLEVPGRFDWTSSGISLKKGQTVRVRAWGRIKVPEANGNFAEPDGLEGFTDPLRLLGASPSCALIAVIGEGDRYIPIGREAEFVAEEEGTLFFGINQHAPEANTGEFMVRVTVGEKGGLSFGGGQGLFGLPPSARPVTEQVTANERHIVVPARLDWTNTAITVRAGDTIAIEASGTVTLDLAGTTAGPDGIAKADAEKLIAEKPTGGLVAVIGIDNNDFIYIGSKGSFTAERSGLLFLGVNEGDLTNNSGAFSARVILAPKQSR